VKRVLANIDADYGYRTAELLRHGVLLVFGAPCQFRSLAGQEHGRAIPLADINGLGERSAWRKIASKIATDAQN